MGIEQLPQSLHGRFELRAGKGQARRHLVTAPRSDQPFARQFMDRGTQINPKLNVNTRLGDTRMEILDKAYDNPAVSLITYCAFPGVPMDFLNASARASWGFIRNQDDQYGVKVVAEEAI